MRETAQITYGDAQGCFTIDSVPLGAQQMTFSSPTLDSLGLYGFARDVSEEAFKRIESLPVNQILAMEYYPSAVGVPLDLWMGTPPSCGLIIIWTIFSRWSR